MAILTTYTRRLTEGSASQRRKGEGSLTAMASRSRSWFSDETEPRVVIGLMSGTSADGVDAACCRLSHPSGEVLEWEVLATVDRSYPEPLTSKVLGPEALKTADLAALNMEIGLAFAEAALEVARAANVDLADVALIGSHGQTVWHDPRGEIGGVAATLQIGEPAVIAERTGCPVWSDFRVADIAAEGEGAPFVPYFDRLALGRSDRYRVCLNIGGIANLTLLPPGVDLSGVIAFDTGPGNILLDGLARELEIGRYDTGGQRAATGTPDVDRLASALADPYFAVHPPKSTGRERFGRSFLERHFGPLQGLEDDAIAERFATAVALTVESIAKALEGETGTPVVPDSAEIVVSGGGRLNEELMRRLAERCTPRAIVSIDDLGLDGDFKEAVAFAVLAYESALGRSVNVLAVTGAKHPARCGKLSLPPPSA